jgi:hypothetical protein
MPLVEAAMNAREDFVSFIDHAQLKGFAITQDGSAAVAARELTAHRKHTWTRKSALPKAPLNGLNVEKPVQFVLPLPEERLRHNEKDPGSYPSARKAGALGATVTVNRDSENHVLLDAGPRGSTAVHEVHLDVIEVVWE